MFCPKCGSEHPDDSQFCRKCGQGLAVPVTSTGVTSVGAGAAVAPARIPEVAPQPAKPLVRAPFAIAGVLLLLLLIYGYNSSQRANPNPAVNPVDRIVKQERTVTAKNPDLHVNALSFSSFKLEVPTGATSVNLHGNFTASGGLTNDVEVFVMSENDFVNWQNRHEAKTFYNSGKVTVGTINVNLPADAGTYYLVFNNRFSLLTQRTVLVDAALTYYQ
jgi:zinc-ribbon domain